jgi:hypothetical protein
MLNRAVAPGQRLQCPKCGTPFALSGPAGNNPSPRAAAPADEADGDMDFSGVSAPVRPPRASGKGLWVVLFFTLVTVGAGVAIVLNWHRIMPGTQDTESDTKKDDNDKDDKRQVRFNKGGEKELPEAKQSKVNQAVDRGVQFLKKTQQADGSWTFQHSIRNLEGPYAVGLTALPGLTLLECGIDKNDPVIRKAADFVRRKASQAETEMTYDMSLAILFLDRLGDKKDEDLIRNLAMRLVAAQTPNGGWSYKCRYYAPEQLAQLKNVLQDMPQPGKLQLVKTPTEPDPGSKLTLEQPASPQTDRAEGTKLTLESEPTPKGKIAKIDDLPEPLKKLPVLQSEISAPQRSDNSNTQFAILALWAARRHNLPLERTLALVVKRFRTSQFWFGGWGYGYTHTAGRDAARQKKAWAAGRARPPMTCAGLLGLALGHGMAADLKGGSDKDKAIDEGLKCLGKEIGQVKNLWRDDPKGGSLKYDMYLLWSVERVGMIYKLREIGKVDWYTWGSDILVKNQDEDGSWYGRDFHGSDATVDTCLALLFLKRVNLVRDLTQKLTIETTEGSK